jgi:hypothetical protein
MPQRGFPPARERSATDLTTQGAAPSTSVGRQCSRHAAATAAAAAALPPLLMPVVLVVLVMAVDHIEIKQFPPVGWGAGAERGAGLPATPSSWGRTAPPPKDCYCLVSTSSAQERGPKKEREPLVSPALPLWGKCKCLFWLLPGGGAFWPRLSPGPLLGLYLPIPSAPGPTASPLWVTCSVLCSICLCPRHYYYYYSLLLLLATRYVVSSLLVSS